MAESAEKYTFGEPAPPLPDVLDKYRPKDEMEEDPVKPREKEPMRVAIERTIRENLDESIRSNYIVGKLLQRIADGLLFTEVEVDNMDEYLDARFPDISRSWAYQLMAVATAFPSAQLVEHFGIKPLSELIQLQQTAPEFKHLQPIDLVEGTHQFADAAGHRMTLNFSEQHSFEHLRRMVGFAQAANVAREGRPATKGKLSESAEKIRVKVEAAANEVTNTQWKVRERKTHVILELESDPQHLARVLKKLAESL